MYDVFAITMECGDDLCVYYELYLLVLNSYLMNIANAIQPFKTKTSHVIWGYTQEKNIFNVYSAFSSFLVISPHHLCCQCDKYLGKYCSHLNYARIYPEEKPCWCSCCENDFECTYNLAGTWKLTQERNHFSAVIVTR